MTTVEDEIRDCILSGMPDEKTILTLVSEKYYPEDVFSEKQLNQWAKENGFLKEDEK